MIRHFHYTTSSRRSSLLYDAETKHWIYTDEIRKGVVKHVQITSLLLHCRDFPFYDCTHPASRRLVLCLTCDLKKRRKNRASIFTCVCVLLLLLVVVVSLCGILYFIAYWSYGHNRLVQFRIPPVLHVWLRDMSRAPYISLHTSIWALSHTNCPP